MEISNPWFAWHIFFIFIFMMYFVLGCFGNLIVFFIYVKYKFNSDGRYFIPFLAVVDILATVFSCLLNLTYVAPRLHDVLSLIGCKLPRFLVSTTTDVSVCIILVIAVDRYLEICRPTWRFIRWVLKKFSFLASVIAAVAISSPLIKLEGESVLKLKEGSTIKVCFYAGESQNVFIIYTMVQLFLIFAILIIIAILYYRIYKVVLRNPTAVVIAENITSSTSDHGSDAKPKSDPTDMTNLAINISSDSQKPTVDRDEVSLQVQIQASVQRVPSSRMIVIFMVITIVSAICFIPTFVVLFLELVFELNTTTNSVVEIWLQLFFRSFYICNNFIKPFIYGRMDKEFQLKLRKMFCCVCRRKIRRMK